MVNGLRSKVKGQRSMVKGQLSIKNYALEYESDVEI